MDIDHRYWRGLWACALNNMPAMAIILSKKYSIRYGDFVHTWTRPAYKRGQATALRICLGYAVYNKQGRSNAQHAVYMAIQRGSAPRDAARQHLLKALAGPHGATLARARLIQLGQADRFKFWPKPGQ